MKSKADIHFKMDGWSTGNVTTKKTVWIEPDPTQPLLKGDNSSTGTPREAWFEKGSTCRKVDIRLPGKGNSNSRGARPVF